MTVLDLDARLSREQWLAKLTEHYWLAADHAD